MGKKDLEIIQHFFFKQLGFDCGLPFVFLAKQGEQLIQLHREEKKSLKRKKKATNI